MKDVAIGIDVGGTKALAVLVTPDGEILDELRRRAGDMQRPKEELDYIDRLLKTY